MIETLSLNFRVLTVKLVGVRKLRNWMVIYIHIFINIHVDFPG